MKQKDLTKTDLAILRELVLGELSSLTELPAYDKLESCYHEEYSELRQLAERLGAKIGKFQKQLKASAKQAAEAQAADKAYAEEMIRAYEHGLPWPPARLKR